MRMLGIDYGTRNVGVAVTGELGLGPRGMTTLRDLPERTVLERLADLVREAEAEGVVVGVPVQADGAHGEAAERVLGFVERLKAALDVPVYTVGERLTSFEAEERMRELGMKADERKRRVDEMAATIILEEYLGRLEAERLHRG